MTEPANDPVLSRAIDELRRLPPLDAEAIQRVVQMSASARLAPADEPVAPPRGRAIRLWSALGLAAAAAALGFVIRGPLMSRTGATAATPATADPPSPTTAPALRAVGRGSNDVTVVPQQFVLTNSSAKRVSLVGDFNNWNPSTNPMSRTSSGLWSAIVPISVGRHVYGFMIDDSVFMLDPRAAKARDPDLGTDASVVLVGRP